MRGYLMGQFQYFQYLSSSTYQHIIFKMVFKVRDRSLYWVKGGWKNNYYCRVFNMPRACNPTDTYYLVTRRDHHSYLRMVQSYRNYSRTCKQYFYGDKKLQQALQMQLRAAFHIPFTCTTPVELVKHGAERRMADQLDREHELMTYNYHPLQIYAYRLQNKRLRIDAEEAEAAAKGQQTTNKALEQIFESELAAEAAKLPQGEKLSIEKMGEIYTKISGALRNQTEEGNVTKGSDGEYTDYLEKRRPFEEASDLRYSH